MRPRIGLVHGGGRGAMRESNRALCLLADAGAVVRYVCVNDIGAVFPGQLHEWATLHPDKLPAWEAARAERGHPDVGTRWTVSRSAHVDRLVRTWTGGSSGLLGVDVALNGLGMDGAVLCGVPMDDRPNDYNPQHADGWGQFRRFRSAWLRVPVLEVIRPRVRSMSGWTRELLGAPTEEWVKEMGGDA